MYLFLTQVTREVFFFSRPSGFLALSAIRWSVAGQPSFGHTCGGYIRGTPQREMTARVWLSRLIGPPTQTTHLHPFTIYLETIINIDKSLSPFLASGSICRADFLIYGGFLKWWCPQNTPKWSFLVGSTIFGNTHILSLFFLNRLWHCPCCQGTWCPPSRFVDAGWRAFQSVIFLPRSCLES